MNRTFSIKSFGINDKTLAKYISGLANYTDINSSEYKEALDYCNKENLNSLSKLLRLQGSVDFESNPNELDSMMDEVKYDKSSYNKIGYIYRLLYN